jgi:hypothetical protein
MMDSSTIAQLHILPEQLGSMSYLSMSSVNTDPRVASNMSSPGNMCDVFGTDGFNRMLCGTLDGRRAFRVGYNKLEMKTKDPNGVWFGFRFPKGD